MSIVQQIEYTPYGSIASTEPHTPSPVSRHLFTGKELDSTGLYFYGARYYDPEIGRFISADTIVQSPYDPQSLNRYSYCRNNPINYVDPTGHSWSWKKFWHAAVGALVGVAVGIILGPAGLAWYGSTMAGIIGGATGGAITGGLEGGWKGALIGAATGGALGGLGGWGVSNFGWGFGAGMLMAGAGVAGATNSWDSFAGGFTGGLCGAAVGGGIVDSKSFQNWKTGNNGGLGKPTNGTADGNVNKALIVDKGKAASGDSITSDPVVLEEFRKAYADTLSPGKEQGGWVVRERSSPGSIRTGHYVERWLPGDDLEITVPKIRPPGTVGEFHTHLPGGIFEPSPKDYRVVRLNPVVYGLKTYIVGEEGVISYIPAENMSDLGTGSYNYEVRWK